MYNFLESISIVISDEVTGSSTKWLTTLLVRDNDNAPDTLSIPLKFSKSQQTKHQ